MKYQALLSGGCAVLCLLGAASVASAQAATNDPSVGGNLNKCWGEIVNQMAKLDTPDGTSGGGMGQHARATVAADMNGGFAVTDNGFGITFNVDGGRDGVGNVSREDQCESGRRWERGSRNRLTPPPPLA